MQSRGQGAAFRRRAVLVRGGLRACTPSDGPFSEAQQQPTGAIRGGLAPMVFFSPLVRDRQRFPKYEKRRRPPARFDGGAALPSQKQARPAPSRPATRKTKQVGSTSGQEKGRRERAQSRGPRISYLLRAHRRLGDTRRLKMYPRRVNRAPRTARAPAWPRAGMRRDIYAVGSDPLTAGPLPCDPSAPG